MFPEEHSQECLQYNYFRKNFNPMLSIVIYKIVNKQSRAFPLFLGFRLYHNLYFLAWDRVDQHAEFKKEALSDDKASFFSGAQL